MATEQSYKSDPAAREITRRQFLRLTGAAAIGATLAGSGCTTKSATSGRRQASGPGSNQAYLAVAHGGDPAAITKAALTALGGIERFVTSYERFCGGSSGYRLHHRSFHLDKFLLIESMLYCLYYLAPH